MRGKTHTACATTIESTRPSSPKSNSSEIGSEPPPGVKPLSCFSGGIWGILKVVGVFEESSRHSFWWSFGRFFEVDFWSFSRKLFWVLEVF